jgi:hypothetical protein
VNIIANLPRCRFDGWRVPVIDMDIRSSRRRTIHEYRGIDGGATEDLGRGIYTFQISTTFQADPRFSPPLWPDTMNALRGLYNAGRVGTLVVPHIGDVRCKIVDWSERFDGSVVSGFTGTISFEEDEANRFLPQGVQVTAAALESTVEAFKAAFDEALPAVEEPANAPLELVPTAESRARGLFETIADVADQILAIKDQVELSGELIASRLDFFKRLMKQASETLPWLDDPENHEVLYALRDMQAAAIDAEERRGEELVRPQVFVVDREMTLMQASTRIFGTTDRGRDILGLNDIPNAMRIQPGHRLLYLPDAA